MHADPQAVAAPDPRRPALLDAGLFLIVVAVPLTFLPLSHAPFVDVKLVLLVLGTLLVWASGVRADPRLAVVGGVWVAATAVAAFAGVDVWHSLAGSARQGTGLVLVGTCALLLAIGPNLPDGPLDRLPRMLVGATATISAILVLFRLAPGAFEATIPGLSFWGSTLGNPVFAGAAAAVGVAALIALEDVPTPRALGLAAVLGAGMAANGQRSGLILPVVALGVAAWRSRTPVRRWGPIAAVLVAVLVAWLAIDGLLPQPTARSAAGQLGTLGAERARLAVWSADLRGFARRPVLGWGPGNTWSAFVGSGTADELDLAGRGWGDAHNLVLEMLVTTGVVGTAAFLVLLWLPLRAAARAPAELGWAVGGLAALLVFHVGQPVSVSLTPLTFLLAGLAAGPAIRAARAGRADASGNGHGGGVRRAAPHHAAAGPGRTARPLVGAALVAGLMLSSLVLVASSLERWARSHFAPWAYRASISLQPWRLSAIEGLAIERALDARSGEEGAAEDARGLAARGVREHPWDPGVRLIAADVELLLNDRERFERWIDAHLERFPNDPIEIPDEPSA